MSYVLMLVCVFAATSSFLLLSGVLHRHISPRHPGFAAAAAPPALPAQGSAGELLDIFAIGCLAASVVACVRLFNDYHDVEALVPPRKEASAPSLGINQGMRQQGSLDADIVQAAQSGDMEKLRSFLDRSDDDVLDLREVDGQTLLHVSARAGNSDAVRLLLRAGADPCALDVDNNQPLHIAALQGNAVCVKLLCDRGTNPMAKNGAQKSALDCAVEAGHRGCARLMERAMARERKGKMQAATGNVLQRRTVSFA